jgi:hypothetical protein
MLPEPAAAAVIYRRMQAVLASLLPDRWFEDPRNASHLAAQQWRLCQLLIDQNGTLVYPPQAPLIPALGQLLLDTFTWIGVTGGDSRALKIGELEGYGDILVRKKIESRARDPAQYRDLMTELAIGGWYRSKGIVTPFETEGYPNLRVDNGAEPPLLIECKRLRVTSEARVRAVIKKANSQIKRAGREAVGPYDGAVVLDLADAVGVRYGSSEWRPAVVNDVIDHAHRALSGEKYRSIRRAWVTWDSYRYAHGHRSAAEPISVLAFQRRVAAVLHSGPVIATAANTPAFGGYTTAHMFLWSRHGGGSEGVSAQ